MYVLRAALNISRSSILRRVMGREFQSLGATAENARSPYVFRRVLGTRRLSPDVRKSGRSFRSSMRDDIYPGDWSCKALKVSSRTLNCILFLTGSQWSSVNTGVIWSNFFFFISNPLSDLFCVYVTVCSRIKYLFYCPSHFVKTCGKSSYLQYITKL